MGKAVEDSTIRPMEEKRGRPIEVFQQEPTATGAVYPLSYGQQAIWLLYQLAPESAAYNLALGVRIHTGMDAGALQHALQKTVDRHAAMRTTYTVREGKPVQEVHHHQGVELVEIDASHWSDEQIELQADEIRRRAFDLAHGPVIRASLFKRSATESLLLLVVHHIAIDAWSLRIVLDELRTLYAAEIQHTSTSLRSIRAQYTDFVNWQYAMLASAEGQRLWDYWRGQLAGNLPGLNLLTDRQRATLPTYRPEVRQSTLDNELTTQLRELAKFEQTTLFTVLLAAFDTLLYRYSAQEDILVGVPVAARGRSEFRGTVGYFVNPVMLRASLSNAPTFRSLLSQVHQTVVDGLKHRDYPFSLLIQQLHPERDSINAPLVEIMFNFRRLRSFLHIVRSGIPATAEMSSSPDIPQLEPFVFPQEEEQFELIADLVETDQTIECAFKYNGNLFEAETIDHMLRHFEVVLRGIIANPEQRITDLPILTPAERQQLLIEWNNTAADYARDQCVQQLFEEQAARTPDACAVAGDGQLLTYAQLNRRANQLAHYLRRRGVGPESLVGICIERSVDMLVGLFGILKAGGAYVPLDPAYPAERLAFVLGDTHASIVLTQRQWADNLRAEGVEVICLDTDWTTIERERAHNPIGEVTSENLAYVIYTSGSTGQPKGVMITHLNLVNLLKSRLAYYAEPIRAFLLLSSFAFDSSVPGIFGTLCQGGTIVLPPPGAEHDVEQLAALIAQHRVSHWLSVPSLYASLLVGVTSPLIESLRVVIVAGEVCPAGLTERHFDRLPHAALFNEYGPTEGTVWCCVYKVQSPCAPPNVPIGRPVANAQIYILDSHLQPVPIGVPGELHLGGPGLARGYLNRPALTAEKFIPNPFAVGERLYKTGDLVRYRSDGNLEFLGRIDRQVKVRGFRIEPGEVEAALNQHPAVRDAVVLARTDTSGDRQLVAYLVVQTQVPLQEWRAYLKHHLPEYMVPAAFIILDAMPLLPNGKVNWRALPQPVMAPIPTSTYMAPRTPIEEMIVEIWSEVLEIDGISVHANFFELGGHSLLATQIIARVRDEFQVDLPVRALFEDPTVAELAQRIELARAGEAAATLPPIVRIDRDQPLPLSFSQERMWFMDQLLPGNSAYNVSGAARLSGPLDVAALRRSYNTLIQRHEVLRTTFQTIEGRPVQVIAPELLLDIPLIDLSDLPPAEREVRLWQLATEEASRPFDLDRGPLIRVRLLRLDDEEYVNIETMHHIVTDAWSERIGIREFTALYSAYTRGTDPALPELSIQYVDFAHWQRQWFQGETLERQMAYWRKQLAGVPALELLSDHPRPPVTSNRGALKSMALSNSLLDSLTQLSHQTGATLFMAMLAAFQTLLYRYTGQTDIAVGVPIANRQWVAAEDLIGTFVNTLVMRIGLAGEPTFRELLARVRNVALDAYAHQDLPFAKLVMELQPERDASRSPLFQVMFNLINVPMPPIELPGLTVTPLELDRRGAQFDLTMTVTNMTIMQRVQIDYNVDLFDGTTIDRMLEHYETLLHGIVANPDQCITDLPILMEAERRQLLIDWNDTVLDYPQATIQQLFETQAACTPEAVALIEGEQRLTYHELNTRANQVAHYLRSRGVIAETPVAICLPRTLDLVASLLGILKAGGAYVPLDPASPKDRLAFMLDDSGASILLTQRELADRFPEHPAHVVCLDVEADAIAQQCTENPAVDLSPDALAYVIYTSGSTGTPKGVEGLHRGAINRFYWMWRTYPFQPGEVCCQKTYLSFVDSVWEVFGPLLRGVPIVMIPDDVLKDDRRLTQMLADYQVTRVVLVPSLLRVLLAAYDDLQDRLPNLKYWVSSGEALSLELAQRFGQVMPNAILINLYGSSEVAADSTYYEVKPGAGWSSIPIGRPIANTQVYLLDAHRQPVPIGVMGEIYIGGDGLARGYHGRPDLTEERFTASPFASPAGGWNQRGMLYKTGDLGRYLSDGNLEYMGRIDDQVKIRGFRIELGEIEAALRRHAAIQQAVVIAREDSPGDKRLVAYCVLKDDGPSTQNASDPSLSSVSSSLSLINDLRNSLKDRLPDYMLPAAFVRMDTLPLMPSGKFDRRALPKPDSAYALLDHEHIAPRDLVERQLTTIWERVLQVKPIGVRNNFFELGGHSLLALELFAQIEKVFGQRPPLTALFQSPTIEQLAKALHTEGWSNDWSTLVAIQPCGSKPPFFCVHGFGGGVVDYGELAHLLGPEQPVYGLQARGIDGHTPPHTQIEAMANHYVEVIRSVQAHGPYYLGGYCFGGVVAFEMARQLSLLGEPVAFVGVFEGYAPARSTVRKSLQHPRPLISFLNNLPYWLRDYLQLGRKQFMARVWTKLRAAAHAVLHAPGQRVDVRLEDYLPNVADIPLTYQNLMEVQLRAMRHYAPNAYNGRITLFRVRGMSLFRAADPEMGWGRLARGVEIKMIAGGHNTILELPHVQSLAAQLKASLEAAQRLDTNHDVQ